MNPSCSIPWRMDAGGGAPAVMISTGYRHLKTLAAGEFSNILSTIGAPPKWVILWVVIELNISSGMIALVQNIVPASAAIVHA